MVVWWASFAGGICCNVNYHFWISFWALWSTIPTVAWLKMRSYHVITLQGPRIMHEIMHEIILTTVVLTLQVNVHEYFIPTSILSCIIRVVSGGGLRVFTCWNYCMTGKISSAY